MVWGTADQLHHCGGDYGCHMEWLCLSSRSTLLFAPLLPSWHICTPPTTAIPPVLANPNEKKRGLSSGFVPDDRPRFFFLNFPSYVVVSAASNVWRAKKR